MSHQQDHLKSFVKIFLNTVTCVFSLDIRVLDKFKIFELLFHGACDFCFTRENFKKQIQALISSKGGRASNS